MFRAPIREAIRLLEADRMVIINVYKEKYVRRITCEDLLETIPVLARLGGKWDCGSPIPPDMPRGYSSL